MTLDFKTAFLIMPLFASVLWGLFYAMSGRFLHQYSFSSYLIFMGAIEVILGIAWMVSANEGTRLWQPFQTGTNGITFLLILAGGILATMITALVMKYVSPTYAAIGEISYPLFVPIFAYLLYRDRQWDMPTIMGGALIFAGLAVLIIGRSRMAAQGVVNANI
jgi:drug/metabolite transporter (DMT)-like permease